MAGGVKVQPKALKRMAAATLVVEQRNLGASTRWKYPRGRRGDAGAAAEEIYFGRLEGEIPAQSALDECITLRAWDSGAQDYEDGDVVGGINNTWSPIRGSAGVPISVWGKLRTITVEVEPDVFEEHRFMEVIWPDLAGWPNHMTTTPDGRPQSPYHESGSDAYQLDGGPCDTDA